MSATMVVDGQVYHLDPNTLDIDEDRITDWKNLPPNIWVKIFHQRGASRKEAEEMVQLKRYGFQPVVTHQGELHIGRAGTGTLEDAQKALDENPAWEPRVRSCLLALVLASQPDEGNSPFVRVKN